MAAVRPRRRLVVATLGTMLVLLYVYLYLPIGYVIYVSFQANPVFPFPADFTLDHYGTLFLLNDFQAGLRNSVVIGVGTGLLATTLATAGAVGILKYRVPGRRYVLTLFLAPMFVANILIGIATLVFNRTILGLPGNLVSTVLANATYGFTFAFLVVLAQLVRYDWRMDDVAMVFGATPRRTFWEVTLPIIWPAMLGAFLVSFILAFNNLEISFYNLGAIPTLPTLAWGSLRHGLKPELYAMAAVINGVVFLVLMILYVLLRTGVLRLGPPDR